MKANRHVHGPRTIAVDLMGSDLGEHELIQGCLDSLLEHPELQLQLLTTSAVYHQYRSFFNVSLQSRLEWVIAEQVVDMDDQPLTVVRKKKMSSMSLMITMIKEKKADACVSAGNTGALMALSQLVLRPIAGVERPALVQAMPHRSKRAIAMLDLGANLWCDSEHLQQYALMGHIWANIVLGKEHPVIKLLNIGTEPNKGYDYIRQAAALLENDERVLYRGYIEGHQLFFDDVDVVVTDGFSGNIVLKTMEGSAHFMVDLIKSAFQADLWRRCLGYLSKPVWRELKSISDPRYRNGACLLGVKGIVIKSHGRADAFAFSKAISQAYQASCMQLTQRIEEMMLQHTTPRP